jgi:putative membrane protein
MSRWKVLAVIFSAAGLLAAIAYAGFDAVGHAAERVGFSGLALLALLHLPAVVLMGYAWSRIGSVVSDGSPWRYVWARYVRESTAEVLPLSQLGGVVAGARVLALSGIDAVSVAGSLLADLIIEQAAKLPYVLAGAILLLTGWRNTSPAILTYALLPALALMIGLLLWRRPILSLLERGAHGLARRMPNLRIGSPEELRLTLDRLFAMNWPTVTAFLAHAAAWVLGAVETWVALHLMGIEVSGTQAFIIDSLYCGLRTFGFAVPAALGVQEACYILVCALVGVPAAPAVALSLVRRVREFLVGTPGLGLWQLLEGRRALAGVPRD